MDTESYNHPLHLAMKSIPFFIFNVLFLVLVMGAVHAQNETPPSLTNFHQFYGQVSNLPNGTFTLRANVSGTIFATSINASGQYGYSSVFKVSGTDGSLIVFTAVNTLGGQTPVGNTTYQSGAVTDITLSYPPPQPPPPTPEEEENETSYNRRPRRNQTTMLENNTLGPCLYNWECGAWSLCRNGQENRICFRIDTCGEPPTNRSPVIATPKPMEQRACSTGTVSPQGAQLCPPATKRCLGQLLQQCSTDGTQWRTLEACTQSCDTLTLLCKQQEATPPPLVQKPFPSWIYYLGGSLVLLVLIILIVVSLIHKKKYAPAKEYIEESRGRGFSDEQVRARLIGQGWKVKEIDRLLK